MTLRHALAAAVLLSTLPARADETTPAPSDAAPGPSVETQAKHDTESVTPTTAPAPVPASEDAAWQLYADTAERFVNRAPDASEWLERLLRDHPGTAAAKRGEGLRLLSTPTLTSPVGRTIDPANPATWLRPEQPEPLARAEVAVVQTVHGIALGIEFCALTNACSVELGALAALAGGGAGLGLSLVLTNNGITPGHALAMNAGTLWGAWHGIALNGILQSGNATATAGIMMGGQLLGLGAGHLLHTLLVPAVGDVSLANSGGIWSTALAALLLGASGVPMSMQATFGILLAATDVGLIAGAFASKFVPMSRGRTLVLDAGFLLGGFVGWALATITGLGSSSGQLMWALTAVGLVAGGAGSFWLTRNWDQPPPALLPKIGLLPTPGGAMANLDWRF